MSAPPLADGPAMYFGGSVMTFALPYGAFIVAAIVLFYLFRARHSGPRLKWSAGGGPQVASVTTREPGPAPAPEIAETAAAAMPAAAATATHPDPEPADSPPASTAPASTAPEAEAEAEAGDAEGKDGEQG